MRNKIDSQNERILVTILFTFSVIIFFSFISITNSFVYNPPLVCCCEPPDYVKCTMEIRGLCKSPVSPGPKIYPSDKCNQGSTGESCTQPSDVEFTCTMSDGTTGYRRCINQKWTDCLRKGETCIPGQFRSATCPNGEQGRQDCGNDGRWGTCYTPQDTGTTCYAVCAGKTGKCSDFQPTSDTAGSSYVNQPAGDKWCQDQKLGNRCYCLSSSTSQNPNCGNGNVDTSKGEECDPPGTVAPCVPAKYPQAEGTKTCGQDCKWITSTSADDKDKDSNAKCIAGSTCGRSQYNIQVGSRCPFLLSGCDHCTCSSGYSTGQVRPNQLCCQNADGSIYGTDEPTCPAKKSCSISLGQSCPLGCASCTCYSGGCAPLTVSPGNACCQQSHFPNAGICPLEECKVTGPPSNKCEPDNQGRVITGPSGCDCNGITCGKGGNEYCCPNQANPCSNQPCVFTEENKCKKDSDCSKINRGNCGIGECDIKTGGCVLKGKDEACGANSKCDVSKGYVCSGTNACSDGTPLGECSKSNLGNRCTSGYFTPDTSCCSGDNVEQCCKNIGYGYDSSRKTCGQQLPPPQSKDCYDSNGYLVRNGECVKGNPPYGCDEGQIKKMSSKCGCPRGYVPDIQSGECLIECNPNNPSTCPSYAPSCKDGKCVAASNCRCDLTSGTCVDCDSRVNGKSCSGLYANSICQKYEPTHCVLEGRQCGFGIDCCSDLVCDKSLIIYWSCAKPTTSTTSTTITSGTTTTTTTSSCGVSGAYCGLWPGGVDCCVGYECVFSWSGPRCQPSSDPRDCSLRRGSCKADCNPQSEDQVGTCDSGGTTYKCCVPKPSYIPPTTPTTSSCKRIANGCVDGSGTSYPDYCESETILVKRTCTGGSQTCDSRKVDCVDVCRLKGQSGTCENGVCKCSGSF